MDGLANQKSQLVSILARGRNPHSASPVVVQVAHLVRQLLHVVGSQESCVMHNVEVGWASGTLSHTLWDEVKVVMCLLHNGIVNDRAGGWVLEAVVRAWWGEESGIDTLGDNNHCQLRVEIWELLESTLNLGYFEKRNSCQLAFSNTITVDNHTSGELALNQKEIVIEDIDNERLSNGIDYIVCSFVCVQNCLDGTADRVTNLST